MPQLSPRVKGHIDEGVTFIKWILYAGAVGWIVGMVGVAFHYGIDLATELRMHHSWLIFLLPVGGMAIILLYRLCGMEKDRGTNLVLTAVREAQPLKLRTAPLIFISTILTHLVGGSAGREGAALQLGGSLSAYIGRKIGLDEKDGRMMVMCGMAAAFSALFGTPMTAAIFAMEVVSVGVMYYAAMVPCMVSAMVGLQVSRFFGMHFGDGYLVGDIPRLAIIPMVRVVLLGVLCALLSTLFCKAMHTSTRLYAKYLPNPLIRAAVGGALVLALTLLVGAQTYNGSGEALAHEVLHGEAVPWAPFIKILITALTLGAGFRGGEIVPALCAGATFGTVAGPLLGLSQSFGGALGMVAVFCGATNCPLSAILLAYELFGGTGLPYYALCCAVSYMLSGYYSLYSEQKIVYSKFRAEWIDTKAK